MDSPRRRRDHRDIGTMGEDALVRRVTRDLPTTAHVLTRAGEDDCAVVRRGRQLVLLKTDAMVADIHFTMETAAARVGWKALCRGLSDLASSGGGLTSEALLTLAMPPETPLAWVDGFYRGLRKAARQFHCAVVGGETTSMPRGAPIVISVALSGEVSAKRLTLRSGGHAGDVLCVTGVLGGSLRGWHLDFTPRIAEAQWLTQAAKPSAMMDVSDGLAKDLPRLADASGCDFALTPETLPRRRGCDTTAALTDGEDYELLIALSPRRFARAVATWPFSRVPLTCIGRLTPLGSGRPLPKGGWDHFAL
jgi:thiamine-monophosphate kinase